MWKADADNKCILKMHVFNGVTSTYPSIRQLLAQSVCPEGGLLCAGTARALPRHRHPEPGAKPGYGDARADSQVLPSTCMRVNCLWERRRIVCYYSLSLKKSLEQEDRNIPNAWAELAVAGVAVICWVSSPVSPLEYADRARQGWAGVGPSQHKITVGKHLTW